jgi:hypothetical protein
MNEEIERKSEFDQNYVELGPKKYDPHLGEYKIKRNMTGNDLVFVKEYQSTSKSQAITVLNSLAKRKELKIVNLMQLKDFSCKDESHFCGSFYNYKSYYEYYELNLKLFKERLINAPDEIIEMILTKFVYDMVALLLT